MYVYGMVRAKLDKNSLYNLENEQLVRGLLPILFAFMPDDKSKEMLKK
jgi:hypothetical protein